MGSYVDARLALMCYAILLALASASRAQYGCNGGQGGYYYQPARYSYAPPPARYSYAPTPAACQWDDDEEYHPPLPQIRVRETRGHYAPPPPAYYEPRAYYAPPPRQPAYYEPRAYYAPPPAQRRQLPAVRLSITPPRARADCPDGSCP